MRHQQPGSEIGEQRPLRVGIGPRGLEQQLDRDLQSLERIRMTLGGRADLFGGPAQGVFEKSEQELMLAVELQVEAPQRLAGPVHDLLDGEVGSALFDDDGLGGVQETLNALCGSQLCCLDRPFDRALLPGRLFAWAGHRVPEYVQRNENIIELYRRTSCKPGLESPGRRRVRDCNFLTTRIVFS